jgi:hypothetical protein
MSFVLPLAGIAYVRLDPVDLAVVRDRGDRRNGAQYERTATKGPKRLHQLALLQ